MVNPELTPAERSTLPTPNEAKDRFFRLSEKIGHRTIRPVSPRNRARIARAAQSVGRGSNQHLLGSQLEPPEGRANLAQRLSARYDAQKRPSQGETTEIAPHLVKATGEVHARGDGRAEVTLRTAQDQVGLSPLTSSLRTLSMSPPFCPSAALRPCVRWKSLSSPVRQRRCGRRIKSVATAVGSGALLRVITRLLP